MPVEVRFDDDRKVDEIVAKDCTIHLERLSADTWSLVVETATSRGSFTLYKKGKLVEVGIFEIDLHWRRPSDNSEGSPDGQR